MRLSKEDEYIRDESNSISNQRAFLHKHIRAIPELKKWKSWSLRMMDIPERI